MHCDRKFMGIQGLKISFYWFYNNLKIIFILATFSRRHGCVCFEAIGKLYNLNSRLLFSVQFRIFFVFTCVRVLQLILCSLFRLSKLSELWRVMFSSEYQMKLLFIYLAWLSLFWPNQFTIFPTTVCPKSSDPFYIVSYYNIKWVNTSWTYCSKLLHKMGRYFLYSRSKTNLVLLYCAVSSILPGHL